MSSDLLHRVAAGKLEPVYIISSDQPLLLSRAVDAILDAAVPPAWRGFNYDVIEPKDTTVTRIVNTCQTLPMMSERRAVLVRDLAVLAAAEQSKLLPYFESPNPATVLVVLTSKFDKRLKFYAAASKLGLVHELSAPKQIGPWLEAEAVERGVTMNRKAAERLAEVVGKDLARLALAIDQLALYAGDRGITADDVDDLIADTRERSVFELLNAVSRGDLGGALGAVASLCDQKQSPIGVLVMLARHMRSLGLCHAAREQHLSKDAEIASLIGVPVWKVKPSMAEARMYPPAIVGQALERISAADQELKGMTSTVKILGRELGERVILDRLVVDILSLRQAPVRRAR